MQEMTDSFLYWYSVTPFISMDFKTSQCFWWFRVATSSLVLWNRPHWFKTEIMKGSWSKTFTSTPPSWVSAITILCTLHFEEDEDWGFASLFPSSWDLGNKFLKNEDTNFLNTVSLGSSISTMMKWGCNVGGSSPFKFYWTTNKMKH